MSDPAVALDAFAENWRITWRDSIKTGDELVMETAYLALLAEACRFRTEARAGRAAREALRATELALDVSLENWQAHGRGVPADAVSWRATCESLERLAKRWDAAGDCGPLAERARKEAAKIRRLFEGAALRPGGADV